MIFIPVYNYIVESKHDKMSPPGSVVLRSTFEMNAPGRHDCRRLSQLAYNCVGFVHYSGTYASESLISLIELPLTLSLIFLGV